MNNKQKLPCIYIDIQLTDDDIDPYDIRHELSAYVYSSPFFKYLGNINTVITYSENPNELRINVVYANVYPEHTENTMLLKKQIQDILSEHEDFLNVINVFTDYDFVEI
jgi:hypothetical protein